MDSAVTEYNVKNQIILLVDPDPDGNVVLGSRQSETLFLQLDFLSGLT